MNSLPAERNKKVKLLHYICIWGFPASIHTIQTAKILVKGMGILPSSDPRPRITISPGITDAVKAFYCTDEVRWVTVGSKEPSDN